MVAERRETGGRGTAFWAGVASVVIGVAAVVALVVRVIFPESSSAYYYVVHNHMDQFFWTMLLVAVPVYIMMKD